MTRKPTTGRFATRAELEERVVAAARGKTNASLIARMLHVSVGVVIAILKAKAPHLL